MTVEEAEKIFLKQTLRTTLKESEAKDAQMVSEIISILQRNNLSYIRASFVLKKCEEVLEQIAKI